MKKVIVVFLMVMCLIVPSVNTLAEEKAKDLFGSTNNEKTIDGTENNYLKGDGFYYITLPLLDALQVVMVERRKDAKQDTILITIENTSDRLVTQILIQPKVLDKNKQEIARLSGNNTFSVGAHERNVYEIKNKWEDAAYISLYIHHYRLDERYGEKRNNASDTGVLIEIPEAPEIKESQLKQDTDKSLNRYLAIIGINVDDNTFSGDQTFLDNLNNVYIMGVIGSVQHGFTDESNTQIRIMNWVSNDSVSRKEFNDFVNTMSSGYFGENCTFASYDNMSDETFVWRDYNRLCLVYCWYGNDNKVNLEWQLKEDFVTEKIAEIEKSQTEEKEKASIIEAEEITTETEPGIEAETELEEIAPLVRPKYEALDYVTLGTYTDLPIEIEPIVVTDEEVETSIKDRILNAEIYDKVTAGIVEDGDIVNIDFVGKKDGKAFEGGTAQGYELTIGSDTFIPGFEDDLIGVAIGDTVDLNLTFPEDYRSEELASADVVFTVTVNSLRRLSKIDDSVISKLTDGEYSTIESYGAYVRGDLEAQKKKLQDEQINLDLMTQLYNTCIVNEYPVELVDYSIYQMKDYYQQYADMYGMELGSFLDSFFGMDEETFNQEVEMAVIENLQQEMILAAIAEKEKLEVTEEEYQKYCEEYALEYEYPDVQTFQNTYPREQVEHSIRMDKAMQFVHDHVRIIEKGTGVATETDTVETSKETKESTYKDLYPDLKNLKITLNEWSGINHYPGTHFTIYTNQITAKPKSNYLLITNDDDSPTIIVKEGEGQILYEKNDDMESGFSYVIGGGIALQEYNDDIDLSLGEISFEMLDYGNYSFQEENFVTIKQDVTVDSGEDYILVYAAIYNPTKEILDTNVLYTAEGKGTMLAWYMDTSIDSEDEVSFKILFFKKMYDGFDAEDFSEGDIIYFDELDASNSYWDARQDFYSQSGRNGLLCVKVIPYKGDPYYRTITMINGVGTLWLGNPSAFEEMPPDAFSFEIVSFQPVEYKCDYQQIIDNTVTLRDLTLTEICDKYRHKCGARVGSDNSYIYYDTNPNDTSDHVDSNLLEIVQEINYDLKLPESLFQAMIVTSFNDGKETREYDGVNVSWTYQSDRGLEIMYEFR